MRASSRIGITMGDPAGIGPEVICKAIAAMPDDERAATLVIGDRVFMERASRLVGADIVFVPAEGPAPAGSVRLVEVEAPNRDAILPGRLSPDAGEAGCRCVRKAVEMAQAGEIDVIVTASLNKAALRAAGYPQNGHAGLLAHFTGAKRSYAVLACPQFSVIHVSTHVALARAAESCRVERILETIRAGHAHMQSAGFVRPRIAVAGLNPHCGENGLYGTEDDDYVVPAITAARAEGMDVAGPVPGDVVFNQAVDGKYDLVVAQFHDQGHIPAKLIGRHETVNVTAGLPVLRTSVDHGTAFDIAWKGVADPRNMQAAIAMARKMRPV
ncbi:putative D-threonate 4-phosphate dehydrogenase [Rhodovastum atsumiense]|uniref:4-hydroxythreonine-4-phosphate dehydrogenase PdxA n=1 Tax=Rhodovastum atsumiense TaxID=504468 RepID=A0A5M6IWM4_9PROT|nr:4-hydroxythreonine-4-phosphate dehydrogenase PdxA [Rhodovastum atsumiense]KAA5612631.1 4-hydroxythreonine-4-phosphate dehydrogenase PdxA [Rhodovastum atsumiense]CAH2601265.1 putative D-threonate 4-phosphate dehydrogenase [Rhodovastum atsumiense]